MSEQLGLACGGAGVAVSDRASAHEHDRAVLTVGPGWWWRGIFGALFLAVAVGPAVGMPGHRLLPLLVCRAFDLDAFGGDGDSGCERSAGAFSGVAEAATFEKVVDGAGLRAM